MLFATILGFAFGFVGSMPVAGPITALVFSRGLEGRTGGALSLAMGAALAEGGYAYLAFWGFGGFLARYAWIGPASRVAAALISLGLGLYFVLAGGGAAEPAEPAARAPRRQSFLLGLTVTALNPTLVAAWTAAITATYSLGLLRFEPGEALPFALGACSGITAWFATLLGFLRRYRTRISRTAVGRLRRAMGVVLVLLGLGLAARLV